jgi:hypothetical protein
MDLAAHRELFGSRSRQPLELTSPRLRALTGVWIRRWFYRILLQGDAQLRRRCDGAVNQWNRCGLAHRCPVSEGAKLQLREDIGDCRI